MTTSARRAFCASGICAAARRRMRDAFYTDTPAWKQSIVTQGLAAAMQALHGLAG